MKKQQFIASRVAVGQTYCFLSSLILWVAMQGVVHAKAQLVHEAVPRDDSSAAAAFNSESALEADLDDGVVKIGLGETFVGSRYRRGRE